MVANPYELARDRDKHRCQYPTGDKTKCGNAFLTEVHHRQRRSHGGVEDLDNLITLCRYHHQHVVHARPAAARELGLLVFAGDDPARRPWMEIPAPDDEGWIDGVGDDPFSDELGEMPW